MSNAIIQVKVLAIPSRGVFMRDNTPSEAITRASIMLPVAFVAEMSGTLVDDKPCEACLIGLASGETFVVAESYGHLMSSIHWRRVVEDES